MRNRESFSAAGAVAAGVALMTAVVLPGCAGYRLGSPLPADVKSIYVPTFVNRCGEPRVDTEATRAAIQEFQRDGTLRVTDAARAHAVVLVTVVKYTLEPLRYERDDTKRTREYRLRLDADLELRRSGSDKPMLKRRLKGESTFVPSGDLECAKQSALPKACEDLAHRVVESVVEYW